MKLMIWPPYQSWMIRLRSRRRHAKYLQYPKLSIAIRLYGKWIMFPWDLVIYGFFDRLPTLSLLSIPKWDLLIKNLII